MRSGWRRALRACGAIVVAIVAAVTVAATDAQAARRAFIVGNANYLHSTALANPANDARDLATQLRELGWDVTVQFDASRSALLKGFASFSSTLKPDDLSLVYFAGHAMQFGGENYLAPVDAQVKSEDDVRRQFVPLNALLSDLSRLTRTRIVILDACRDNPLAEGLSRAEGTRSLGTVKGLARVYAGVGSFIVYSTQPGNVALDGTGRNSPFTKALLDHMSLAGADVHAVMRRVRADVQLNTSEQQIPWENSSLIEEVAFGSGGVSPTAALPPSASSTPAAPPSPGPPASQQTATRGTPARPAPPPENFHYVTGLDPKGDNFLALRTGPLPSDSRIATMGPDTLLRVRESSGVWRRVELIDGMSGWAHSKWIACCRTLAARPWAATTVPASPSPPPPSSAAPAAATSCDGLWRERNAIWHRHGYCFTTARGRAAFDTSSCFRDQGAARAAMSASERSTVDALLARERAQGCR
jgi:Caspase domain/YARHG domain/Bacterial SH3 domain